MQLHEATENFEAFQVDKIDKAEIIKFEAKIRDLENKVESEHVAKVRAESQIEKYKDQLLQLEQVRRFSCVYSLTPSATTPNV